MAIPLMMGMTVNKYVTEEAPISDKEIKKVVLPFKRITKVIHYSVSSQTIERLNEIEEKYKMYN